MSALGERVVNDVHVVEHKGTRPEAADPVDLVFWTWVGSWPDAETAQTAATIHTERYPGAVVRVVHEVTTVTRHEVVGYLPIAGDEADRAYAAGDDPDPDQQVVDEHGRV